MIEPNSSSTAGNDESPGRIENIEDIEMIDEMTVQEDLPHAESKAKQIAVLTEEEEAILNKLPELGGIHYQRTSGSSLVFMRSDSGRGQREVAIPHKCLPQLKEQLTHQLVQHPTVAGFLMPSCGYAEIVLGDTRRNVPIMYEKIVSLNFEHCPCRHEAEENQLFTLPFTPWTPARKGSALSPRVHLASLNSGPCVEISNASPVATLLYGGRMPFGRSFAPRVFLLPTIKIDYARTVDGGILLKEADEIVRSLIYELDVRNGFVFSTNRHPLPTARGRRASQVRQRTDIVRYPQIRVQHEVSDLFGFAGQAYDNPPLAFLSYYQTLEYFIPAAVRANALKRIRLELRDPAFDRNSDESLLRIISAAETTMRLPEARQLRTLVSEYVRSDRLEEFFAQDWGNHFSRSGPIKGVENINSGNASKELSDQVADRIYQIRNRIVHAKDDRRYDEARVLLPRSREAEALGPDVELVRLLAMEAIVSSQNS